MASDIKWLSPGPKVSEWPRMFQEAELDWVPDPMVLRAAEIFSAGRKLCEERLKLDGSRVWPAIEQNIDGILAFFHALMTRERIPFIDYNHTYHSIYLRDRLGSIGLDVHPSRNIYESIKAEALGKLKGFNASRLPKGMAANLGEQLEAVGYEWAPRLDDLLLKKADRQTASFVMGGLIFGGYAQASGTDHLLQNTRAKMFVALAEDRRPHTTRGIKKERELFAALNRLTNQDEHFKLEQEHSPPTILQYLLAKGIENSQRLLDEALKIRDEPASRRYRKWHRKVRDAWARGHRDANAEAELDAVTKELQNRISGKPTVVTKIKVQGELRGEAKVGVDLGLGKASVSARGKVSVNPKDIVFKVPTRMRNWFVDKLVLSRHQKLLLEMSLDRRSFDDLAYGLKTVWAQS